MSKVVVQGSHYRRALAYAYKIVPSADEQPKLQQIVFIGNQIVASDGRRWHAGHLPKEDVNFAPLVVAPASIDELLIHLVYAEKIAKLHGGNFLVEQDGEDIRILYGHDRVIEHHLASIDVGYVPPTWTEPVSIEAPVFCAMPKVSCDVLKDAVGWWLSWEKEHGDVIFKGYGGEKDPIRAELTIQGNLVASAFLLPSGFEGRAQLPADEPLFAGTEATKRGQSILDLQVMSTNAVTIKIGDEEINVTGLPDPDSLLKTGPCDHRDTQDPCSPCTHEAVEAALARNGEVLSKKKRGRKPKAKTEEVAEEPVTH